MLQRRMLLLLLLLWGPKRHERHRGRHKGRQTALLLLLEGHQLGVSHQAAMLERCCRHANCWLLLLLLHLRMLLLRRDSSGRPRAGEVGYHCDRCLHRDVGRGRVQRACDPGHRHAWGKRPVLLLLWLRQHAAHNCVHRPRLLPHLGLMLCLRMQLLLWRHAQRLLLLWGAQVVHERGL